MRIKPGLFIIPKLYFSVNLGWETGRKKSNRRTDGFHRQRVVFSIWAEMNDAAPSIFPALQLANQLVKYLQQTSH